MARVRLDSELVRRGLAVDVDAARDRIEKKAVVVDGSFALNPGALVDQAAAITIQHPSSGPSRAGGKLAGALADLGVSVSGKRCCDLGAGHGGFTKVLLDEGAASVVAVDVGYGQLDWQLRNDPRVTVLERTNIKMVEPSMVGPIDLVTADLSFISVASLADPIVELVVDGGEVLLMVKPQFEAPRGDVPPGGVVTDPQVWERSVDEVAAAFHSRGMRLLAIVPSRVKGAEGNQEFFVHMKRPEVH